MSCKTCGRPAENGTPTHYLGCLEAYKAVGWQAEWTGGEVVPLLDQCEHGECSEPKWSDGPRTKYCKTHKDPKSREK